MLGCQLTATRYWKRTDVSNIWTMNCLNFTIRRNNITAAIYSERNVWTNFIMIKVIATNRPVNTVIGGRSNLYLWWQQLNVPTSCVDFCRPRELFVWASGRKQLTESVLLVTDTKCWKELWLRATQQHYRVSVKATHRPLNLYLNGRAQWYSSRAARAAAVEITLAFIKRENKDELFINKNFLTAFETGTWSFNLLHNLVFYFHKRVCVRLVSVFGNYNTIIERPRIKVISR